jgi:type IV pilus assembly protein PilE
MQHVPKNSGFTLIELMIAVAAIAILAAIAFPNYQEYVRRGRRADAQSFLQEIAARQQHFLVDRRAYSASVTDAPSAGGLGLSLPTAVSPFYSIALVTDNAARPPTFTVSAAPKGTQSTEKCGTLSVNARGVKAASGVGTCW